MKKIILFFILFFILSVNVVAEERSCDILTGTIFYVFWTLDDCPYVQAYSGDIVGEEEFKWYDYSNGDVTPSLTCKKFISTISPVTPTCSQVISLCNSDPYTWSPSLECLYDDQIKYSFSTGASLSNSGIYAEKAEENACDTKTTLSGYYTDSSCYYNSLGCADSGYSLGSYKYYNFKRKNIIKNAPSTTPSSYISCWSRTHSIPYDYNQKKYVYNCNDLTYTCLTKSYTIEYVKGISTCSSSTEYTKLLGFSRTGSTPNTYLDDYDQLWGRYDTSPTYKCTVTKPVPQYSKYELDVGEKQTMKILNKTSYCVTDVCPTWRENSYFEDLNFSCSSSCSSSLKCGLIGIVKNATSYKATLMALHMWATYKGSNVIIPSAALVESDIINPNERIDISGTSFLDYMYSRTISKITGSNYKGIFEGTGYVPEIMFQEDTTYLANAIDLFNKCRTNKLNAKNSSSPSVKPTATVADFSQSDVATIVFKTSFDSSTKVTISASDGVKIDSVSKVNKDGEITVKIIDYSDLCYKNIKSFNLAVSATGSGATSITSYVKKYTYFYDGNTYFLTYNPTKKYNYFKTFTFDVKCSDCDDSKLSTEKTPSGDGNCNTGTTVTFDDPTVDKLIKACPEQKKDYLYERINQYCYVYCSEDIDIQLFPVVSGTAGRYFQYNLTGKVLNQNVMTVVSTSKLSCESEIRYGKWKRDYLDANASEKAKLLVDIKNCNLYKDSGTETSFYQNIINDYKDNYQSDMDYTYAEKNLGTTPIIDYKTKIASSTNTTWCTDCKASSNFKTTSSTEVIGGVTVPTNTQALMTTTLYVDYFQSQDYYTQVFTGKISLTPQTDYIQIGDYVYPLNLTTQKGTYDVTLNFSNIGRDGRIVNNKGIYYCKYQVNNSIVDYGDDDGDGDGNTGDSLGFFFRTIDLTDVFPTSRTRGTNWLNADAIIEDIEKTGNDIWSDSVDYSFTLTPANIRSIRSYNDSKEGLNGNGYFNFSLYDCSYNNGFNNCKSFFLSDSNYVTNPILNGRND